MPTFPTAREVAAFGSFTNFSAIVPDDATPVPEGTVALYVGGAGNISVRGRDGTVAALNAVPVGSIIPFSGDRVRSTGTTATNIVAMKVG